MKVGKAKLNEIFGDDGWEEEFYKEDLQQNFFGTPDVKKVGNTKTIAEYICKRLKTVFPWVADNPRILYNSKNSPLFLFCFAVSNESPRAIGLARKVSKHILEKVF